MEGRCGRSHVDYNKVSGLQRAVNIVQLRDVLHYGLPERPMNGLLIYNAL